MRSQADRRILAVSERPNVSAEPVGTLVADDPSGAIRIEPRLIARHPGRRAGFSPETAQVRNLRSRTQGGCLVVSGQSLSGEGNHQSRPEPEYLLSWLPSAFGSSKLTFVNTKFNRRMDRFLRRGRAACRSEWRLMAATHNLLKLHSHLSAQAA